jgi:glutamyl-Q tRNA(Asp) synthetase
LGSLYTALASFLEARSKQGKWLLRIDDLDTPRNVTGAVAGILTTLDAFGLHWDDDVDYQSQHLDAYNDCLEQLESKQLIYPCTCSRRTLDAHNTGDIYPGLCRGTPAPTNTPHALRIKTDDRCIGFQDALQGLITHHLAEQDGDFILARKDQIIAYQFAVVIDDARQAINHIVRGYDLLHSTPRQIYLQQQLGFFTPRYMHVPVIIDKQGYKLSKQTQAQAVELQAPHKVIFGLLGLLKQAPPNELQNAPVGELLSWAITHWNSDLLANFRAITP